MKNEYGFDMPDDYERPEWYKAGRVHDWKDYIGDRIKEDWGSFTDYQKAIIAEHAMESANKGRTTNG